MYLSHEQSTIFCILFCKLFLYTDFLLFLPVLTSTMNLHGCSCWRIVDSSQPTQRDRVFFWNSKYLVSVFRIRIHWVLIRVRIQHFRLNDYSDPIRIQGSDDKKLNKNLQLKFFIYFLIKNCNFYLSLGLQKRTYKLEGEAFSPQKRTSSTQNMKFLNIFYFCGSILPSWIRIRIHW
jgi:hypothetical protein